MYSNTFKYKGGIANVTRHRNEKLLLFFLVGGKEIPIYQMLNDGLVLKTEKGGDEFTTKHKIAKLFISQQGFGIQKMFYSFYIQFLPEENAPDVTIFPFSIKETQMMLTGKFRFLKKEEILATLDDKTVSYKFAKQQQPLPVATINKIIYVDRTNLRKGVRHVRLGRRINNKVELPTNNILV